MDDAARALTAWDLPGVCSPVTSGLINRTFVVRDGDRVTGVLQQLNTRIFRPDVHEDIDAVTTHLAERGLETPRLVRTRAGERWHTDPDGGVWRILTPVGDRTVERLTDRGDAREGARLVARFHAATRDLVWRFRMVRPGAHDTARHVAALTAGLERHRQHRHYDAVARLAEGQLAHWAAWGAVPTLPERVIHGDLKISNLRFRGAQAVALIDLDTLAYGTLDVELGDALRSWCNPASEDAAAPHFDLDLFEAAIQGYAEGCPPDAVTDAEWAALVPGAERIALELSCRFALDALDESYFGWNPRFGGRGEHNLLRARGQAALAADLRAHRADAEARLQRARRAAHG